MGDFYRNNRKRFGRGDSERFARRDSERSDAESSGGRPKRRDFERSSRNPEQRIVHEAICDRCGNRCELPFKPTGDKPVYCSNCFTAKGGNDRNDRGGDRGSRSFSKPSFNAGRRDNFKPTIDSGSNETLKNQIDAINKKIDNLTSLVAGLTNAKSVKPIKIETKAETKTETKKVVKKPTVKVATKKVAKKVAKKSNKK